MGDITACVNEALSAGTIPKKAAMAILNSPNPEVTLKGEMFNMTQAKRESMLSAIALNGRNLDMTTPNLLGEVDAGEGLNAMLSRSETFNIKNADKNAAAIAASYHGKNNQFLSKFRTRMLGWSQDKQGLNDLVSAIYGKTVDDPDIMAYAKTLTDTFEEMRLRFNKAGGAIFKNDLWRLPQVHDRRAIVGRKDEWIADAMAWADREAMKGDNGQPLTNAELKAGLEYMYESILTDGLSKLNSLAPPKMRGKMSRRHSDTRFLFFKDAESWIAYNEKYGKSDIFTTITGHIDSMAHDISLMEMFGPNPNNAYETLRNEARRLGASTAKLAQADSQWAVVSGKVNGGDLQAVGDIGAASGNVITWAVLGGTYLAAIPGAGFRVIIAACRGIQP